MFNAESQILETSEQQEGGRADQFYQTIVENALEGIWVIDTKGFTTYVNNRMAEMLGYSIHEMLGKSFYEFMDGEATRQATTNLEKRRDGVSEQHSFMFRRKNGSNVWTMIATNPMYNEEQEVIGAVAFVSDLTEARVMNQALIESERKYRALHESLMDGFVLVDMHGQIVEFNESYRLLLGYDRDELHRKTYVDITPECWHAIEAEIVTNQILLRGYSNVYEKEYVNKKGSRIPVELRTFLIRNEHGDNEGMWAIVRDISIRKKAEGELKQREKEYRELMEQAADAILVAKSSGQIIAANAKASVLFGFAPEELTSKSVQELIDFDTEIEMAIEKSVAEGKASQVRESKGHRKNGEVIFLESNMSRLANGNLQFIIRDVSARKYEEEEFMIAVESEAYEKLFVKLRLFTHGGNSLQILNRLDFLSGSLNFDGSNKHRAAMERFKAASQEFLAVTYPEVISIVSLLRAVGRRDVHGDEISTTLERSIRMRYHADAIRQAIISLASLQNGPTSSTREQKQHSIADHVAAIKQNMREVHDAFVANCTSDVSSSVTMLLKKYDGGLADIEFSFENTLQGEKAVIRTTDLCVILSTLIENAIEELSGCGEQAERKQIRVVAQSEGAQVLISVCDNGGGVPESIRASLFDYGTSTKGRLRGFGLSYVRSSLQKYGGTVEYHSPHEGGSCFVIRLARV
jgi:PAS domain S-box-containing protein